MNTELIRELNDKARAELLVPENERTVPCLHVLTKGTADCFKGDALRHVIESVANYTDFNEENDPHAEHDYASFDYLDTRVLWKVDYYDNNMEYLSDDPADLTKTKRVLTIYLASEH